MHSRHPPCPLNAAVHIRAPLLPRECGNSWEVTFHPEICHDRDYPDSKLKVKKFVPESHANSTSLDFPVNAAVQNSTAKHRCSTFFPRQCIAEALSCHIR
eukprot:jgi/Botrbrau1/3567/Bobra.0078s0024.1